VYSPALALNMMSWSWGKKKTKDQDKGIIRKKVFILRVEEKKFAQVGVLKKNQLSQKPICETNR
jgi:hypothetical protein